MALPCIGHYSVRDLPMAVGMHQSRQGGDASMCSVVAVLHRSQRNERLIFVGSCCEARMRRIPSCVRILRTHKLLATMQMNCSMSHTPAVV